MSTSNDINNVERNDATDYLTRLNSPTLDNILATVRQRYQNGDFFTKLGENALLVVGGSGALAESTAEVAAQYAKWVIDSSPDKRDLPPHIFDMAASCFYHMTRDHRNQSVSFLGEDASEKSEIRKLFVWQLMMLSTTTEDVMDQKILRAATLMDPVFEAFAHARTVRSRSATFACKYVEYQYDHNWKLVGVGTIAYQLDKSRFSSVPHREENYPVFYYLLAGCSSQEKLRWKLNDASSFRYLQGSPFFHVADDDRKQYNELQVALKHLRMGFKLQKQISQALAAILHLGNITFVEDETRPQDPCGIEHREPLDIAADLLGVDSRHLEEALVYKTRIIGQERISMFLTSSGAARQRDLLASTLYAELVAWIIRKINACLCKSYEDEIAASIRVFETPGFRRESANDLDKLLYNSINENLHFHMTSWVHERSYEYAQEGVLTFAVENPETQFMAITEMLSFDMGLLRSLDNEAVSYYAQHDPGAQNGALLPDFMTSRYELVGAIQLEGVGRSLSDHAFQVRHYNGPMDYDYSVLIEANNDVLSSSMSLLFLGTVTSNPSANGFVRNLFLQSDVYAEAENFQDDRTIVSQFLATSEQVMSAMRDAAAWFVLSVDSGESPLSDKVDYNILKNDLLSHQVTQQVQMRVAGDYVAEYTHEEFISQFHSIMFDKELNEHEEVALNTLCEEFAADMGWSEEHMALGLTKVFLSEKAWRTLQDKLRAHEEGSTGGRWNAHLSQFENISKPFADNDDIESEADGPDQLDMDMKYVNLEQERLEAEERESRKPTTGARKRWLCCTWLLTWWIPPFCMSKVGRMPRKDIQLAWREKLALNLIIISLCLILLGFIIGLPMLICPKQKVMSLDELRKKTNPADPWAYGYGKAYPLKDMLTMHGNAEIDMNKFRLTFGRDISGMFYRADQFGELCPGVDGAPSVAWDNIPSRPTDISLQHRKAGTAYFQTINKIAKMDVGFQRDYVAMQPLVNKSWIILFDKVYDVTTYKSDPFFKNPAVDRVFTTSLGLDATKDWVSTVAKPNPEGGKAILNCMNNLFYIGIVDNRLSMGCQFSNYILLASSLVVISIIGMKFLVAVQFTRKPTVDPTALNRFVICQMPCYTEGEGSLRKSLESVACMDYDDPRKLIFVICDGMVIGSGNSRPTPRIVLDILGVDPKVDPKPFIFQSVGEGDMQLNRAKVYSGLYVTKQGLVEHTVPYIVVVKVGKESEVAKPGNRGKRDSQLLLMKFLSRVHFDSEMEPLELELYRTMTDVIGIHPSMYEMIFMVDADTEVFPDSLGQLVHTMANDTSILGLCGETILANKSESWITKIQVYEYFISHHLTKAFEAIFGAVTCLPGCFCIYRIRSSKNVPLLNAPEVIDEFRENRVDTLHLKNLFLLGEDRFLTTLMMKHFPHMKTSFTPHARCRTVAPEKWKILLSQRRRWINSTVHNLFELMFIRRLCGFLCCSMRFVVFLDLLSTLIQPACILYIAYLVYSVVSSENGVPIISIVLLAAIYGLQVIVFLLKREWKQIIWMVIYIFAIPVFAFYLPLYAFWHFDDFSWGNTRVVYGDGGKKTTMIADTGKFDPASVPMRKWSEHSKEKTVKENDAKREREENEKRRLSYRVMSVMGNNGRTSIIAGNTTGTNFMAPSRCESPPRYQTNPRSGTPIRGPPSHLHRMSSSNQIEYVSRPASRADSPLRGISPLARPMAGPPAGRGNSGTPGSSNSSDAGKPDPNLEQAIARATDLANYHHQGQSRPHQQTNPGQRGPQAEFAPSESSPLEIHFARIDPTNPAQGFHGNSGNTNLLSESKTLKSSPKEEHEEIHFPHPQKASMVTTSNTIGDVRQGAPIRREQRSCDSPSSFSQKAVSPTPAMKQQHSAQNVGPTHDGHVKAMLHGEFRGASPGTFSKLDEMPRERFPAALPQQIEVSATGLSKEYSSVVRPVQHEHNSDRSESGRSQASSSTPSSGDNSVQSKGNGSQGKPSGNPARHSILPGCPFPAMNDRRASYMSVMSTNSASSGSRPLFPMPHPMERRASELSIGGVIRRRDRQAYAETHEEMRVEATSPQQHQQYQQRGNDYRSSYMGGNGIVAGPLDVVGGAPPGLPDDRTLAAEVQRLLERSDLMSISKKSIRDALSEMFGVDLTPKKQLISDVIEEVLERMVHGQRQL
ncbi:chitin synthase-domain-containing protein [Phlyctochytrium arcticum]|nr:chitin synthase-domain-containing protein [Phlyctochytrium arcticum]